MAIQQIVPIIITLQGDGTAVSFTYALANLYQSAVGGSIPYGTAGVVPTSVTVNNPPFAVEAASVDTNGNITITFASAPANGAQYSLEVDLHFTSGSAVSSSAVQAANVSVVGSVPVTGTFWPTTQPVSGTVSVNALPAGSNTIGAVTISGTPSVVLASTSATSAAVPASASYLGFNSSGNLVGVSSVNPLPITGTISASNPSVGSTGSSAPVSATEMGIIVAGNLVGISASNPIPVSGAFYQATQPISGTVSISGTVAATQSGTWTVATNADGSLAGGAAASKSLAVGGIYNSSLPSLTSGQQSAAQIDSSGRLICVVQGTPAISLASTTVTNTVAVSGTFWQTTQPISGTVTANAGTGTFAISAGSLPLPSNAAQETGGNLATLAGAVSSSKVQVNITNSSLPVTGTFWQTTQPVSGTVSINAIPAGSNTIGAVTISGTPAVSLTSTTITGTVAVTQSTSPWVTNDSNAIAQGSTTSGEKGFLELGAVSTSSPSYTNAQSSPLSLTTAGALRVDASATTQPVSIASMPTTPVTGTFWQTTQPVSGTVTANAGTGTFAISASSLPLPSNAAQETGGNLATLAGTVSSSKVQVNVTNANIPVTGTFWQATQPVSGTVSINAIPAGSNSIGTVVLGAGSASVGTVTANAGTGTFAVANGGNTDSAPVTQNVTAQDTASTSTSGANNQSLVTGTPTTGSAASFNLSSGYDAVRIQVTGTWTGTLSVEESMDGTTWVAFNLHQGTYTTSSYTGNFIGAGVIAGATNVRIRASAAWTGTATVKAIFSVNPDVVYLGGPVRLADYTTQSNGMTVKAASTAVVAADTSISVQLNPNQPNLTTPLNVTVANASLPVTGTFWQSTQPVSLASSVAVTGTFWQSTQPVSGTVSINTIPAGANVIGAVTQSGTWTVATNGDGSLAGGTAGSKSLAVGGVYNSSLPTLTSGQQAAVQLDSSGRQIVVLQNSTVSIASSQTVAVTQATASNLNATVTGTVTANAGTGPGTAWSVTQTPATTGGVSTNVQLALTTSAQVKASAGQLYGYRITNTNTGTAYVFWYNTTSAPTIGSTTNLIDVIGIPGGASANIGATSTGIACSSGIYVAVSTSPNSSAAPSTGLTITTLYM